eukprot:Transcript_19176.p1 GENE.Transcript_19176~~Transcript_19176.p1  ORF type:complete len:666 (+),score=186.23 Transcript_19176:144-2000(+)
MTSCTRRRRRSPPSARTPRRSSASSPRTSTTWAPPSSTRARSGACPPGAIGSCGGSRRRMPRGVPRSAASRSSGTAAPSSPPPTTGLSAWRVTWRWPWRRRRSGGMCAAQRRLSSHLRCTSAAPPPHLRCISAASPLQVHQEILRSLDAWENECMPMAQLQTNELAFGQVRFGAPMLRRIPLKNVGQTTLQFSFQPLPQPDGEAQGCPPWLTLRPWSGLLLPGETVELGATLHVRSSAASAALNAGRQRLDAILLLRLRNGRDFYVTVSAEWTRTCLGLRLLDELTLERPLRAPRAAAPTAAPAAATDAPATDAAAPASAEAAAAPRLPCELLRLVAALDAELEVAAARPAEAAAEAISRLFDGTAGHDEELVQNVIEALDTGAALPPRCAAALGGALLRWTGSLAEPLVPASLYSHAQRQAEAAAQSQRASREQAFALLQQLPLPHHRALEALVLLLRRVLRAHALAAPPPAAAAADEADDEESPHALVPTRTQSLGGPEPLLTALSSKLASLFGEAVLRAPRRAAGSGRQSLSGAMSEASLGGGSGLASPRARASTEVAEDGAWWKAVWLLFFLDKLDEDDEKAPWRSRRRDELARNESLPRRTQLRPIGRMDCAA